MNGWNWLWLQWFHCFTLQTPIQHLFRKHIRWVIDQSRQLITFCFQLIRIDCNLKELEKTPAYWNKLARSAIIKARDLRPIEHQAKNAILFLGDGMGISTLTAARVLKGQLKSESGEEGSLSFEQFPNVALIKVLTEWFDLWKTFD